MVVIFTKKRDRRMIDDDDMARLSLFLGGSKGKINSYECATYLYPELGSTPSLLIVKMACGRFTHKPFSESTGIYIPKISICYPAIDFRTAS